MIPYFVTGLIYYILSMAVEFYGIVKIYYAVRHDIILSIQDGINFSFPSILNIGKQTLLGLGYGSGRDVFLFQSHITQIGWLWFLPSLFLANAIFYFFLKLFEKYSVVIQLIIIILLAYMGHMIGQYLFLPWSLDISLVSQIFMFAGYVIRKYKVYEKKAPVWFYIAAVSLWLLDLYMGPFSMNSRQYNNLAISITGAIAASYLIIYLSYVLSKNISLYYKSITYLGRHSLVIYCYHVFDILVCSPVIRALALEFLYQNNYWLALTVIRLFYSLLFIKIISYIPVFKLAYYPRK